MSYTNGLDNPSLYFNTKLYTGNGSTQSISGIGFQPDFLWFKNRDETQWHQIYDVIRGIGSTSYYLSSNTTNAEASTTNSLTGVSSDGFSLGNNTGVNGSADNIVAWNWLADNTSGSSNTDGSITSTVSANTTSGFSIVKFNTSGQSGTMTCGHGLNAVPKMIIVKPYSVSDSWYTYHVGTGNAKYIQLESTNASTSNSNTWASTSPTSSVFSMSTNFWGANTNDIIAYCFSEKKGFSKMGSYVGNGNADGTFVYTGFKPAWVLVKRTDSVQDWFIIDNKRNTFNVSNTALLPNASDSDYTDTNIYGKDMLSNGFKVRGSASRQNGSGGTYIYMAFASNPFVTSTGIPTTAR